MILRQCKFYSLTKLMLCWCSCMNFWTLNMHISYKFRYQNYITILSIHKPVASKPIQKVHLQPKIGKQIHFFNSKVHIWKFNVINNKPRGHIAHMSKCQFRMEFIPIFKMYELLLEKKWIFFNLQINVQKIHMYVQKCKDYQIDENYCMQKSLTMCIVHK